MSPLRLACSLLLFPACVSAPETVPRVSPRSVETDECGAVIAGIDALLSAGKTILLGELHGSRELPAAAGTVACVAARRGPVVVGVELTAHDTFDAFLASDGGDAARAALLAAPAWREPMQDGRTSEAMLALIDRVRRLRQEGRDVELLAFDARETRTVTRDRAMADLVLAHRARRPDATFVLLMGNLHARKVAGSPWQPTDGYGWLASLIDAPGLVALDASYPAGAAWMCTALDAASCGETTVRPSSHPTRTLAVRLESSRAFDGLLDVPSLTASPPAAR